MNRTVTIVACAVAAGAIAAVAWWELRPAPKAVVEAPPAAAAPAPPAVIAEAPAHYPLPPDVAASASEGASDARSILIGLFGKPAVAKMFQLEDFPHRFVATVDNLGRSSATPRLWPVNPTPGRFTVRHDAQGDIVSPDNEFRYNALVALCEGVDMRNVADAYFGLYPQFQKAYEELGYPKGFFNDRLVEVIDQLLQTPEIEGGVRVHLPQINGPLQPSHPWLLYEFDDPALQSLTAGQKLLLRTGVANERRLKARLRLMRAQITANAGSR